MTDSDKIREDYKTWWKSLCVCSEDSLPTTEEAFFAGYIRGQREFALKYLVEEAEKDGWYDQGS